MELPPLFDAVKKGLAEFFARRQKIVLIVFSGGMYVGENSSHGASVELFASRRTTEAQSAVQPLLSKKLASLTSCKSGRSFIGASSAFSEPV